MPICLKCGLSFKITADDSEFLKKLEMPHPRMCPDCRLMHRFMWRNEHSMYHRKCDLTGKQTISYFSPDKPYKVYDHHEWWTDKWDGKNFGQDFDFSQKFFPQFKKLFDEVPHMSMLISHGENSDYCPYTINYKDSYMSVSGIGGENLYFCFHANESRDCMDCSLIYKSELCYECINCESLYNCMFCNDCEDSNDLYFCSDCRGCRNMISCFGLRQKEYHIFNKEVSKEDFKRKKEELFRHIATAKKSLMKKLKDFQLSKPHLFARFKAQENCTGDHLYDCKNVTNCFNGLDLEDCRNTIFVLHSRDCMDCNYFPKGELVYNSISSTGPYNMKCCGLSWDVKNAEYCFECFYSNNLFGCVGLKKSEYCILNKKYSREEYEKLKSKIIKHMKKTGEYGEFFPMKDSPFCYNETIANYYFPKTREEAEKIGLKWKEEEKTWKYDGPAFDIQEDISKTDNSICKKILACEKTGRHYRIIPQELQFYKRMNLPIPRRCPDQRFRNRMKLQNKPTLYDRKCDKCSKKVKTSYNPEKKEKIYCEKCYFEEIY